MAYLIALLIFGYIGYGVLKLIAQMFKSIFGNHAVSAPTKEQAKENIPAPRKEKINWDAQEQIKAWPPPVIDSSETSQEVRSTAYEKISWHESEKPRKKSPKVRSEQEPEILIPIRPYEKYFKPGYEGTLAFNLGIEEPTSEHFLRVRHTEGNGEGELSLSADHASGVVRQYDIAQNKDGVLSPFLVHEGFGTRVIIMQSGSVELQNGAWVLVKPIKIRFV